MCGIAGVVALGNTDFATRATRAMISRLERRGPDGEGLFSWPDTTFGHRRLAIIDLSDAGRQPMISQDGQIGLVFNGCIYNFRELRGELEASGFVFESECDTEVLLHGYRAWGIEKLVLRLRGMFAFGIWDNRDGRLYLVRDRLGVKPLVYVHRNREIAFASTIDALRSAGLTGEVDPEAVLTFLEYGFVADDQAIFEGVHKLPPATILEWRNGKCAEHCYWSVPTEGQSPISFEDAVDRSEELLIESVRLRLTADVPLGVLLSGGVDSTLICWAMAKLNANITAFTVATPGDAEDETSAAAETARRIGIPHRIVPLPESGPDLLDELIAAYSEPFAAASAQGVLLVSRAVKSSATVLLTGDGGDDVFLGYPFLRNAWMAQRFARAIPSMLARTWPALRPAIPAFGPLRRVRSFLDYSTFGLGGHARAHNGLPWFESRSLLGDRLAGLRLHTREIETSFLSARRLLSDVLEFHWKMHFTSEFMPKIDGGTMYHGIEARSPLLDHTIWEFASSLPFPLRFEGGQSKAILREIVRRRVGEVVATRRKQGFTVPVDRLLAGPWRGALDRLSGPTLLEEEGWIQPGRLGGILKQTKVKGSVPLQLWNLLVLELWLHRRKSPPSLSPNPIDYAFTPQRF